MAATLDDEIGTSFGWGGGVVLAQLDGLTEIIYDRVDSDYGPVNEGGVTIKRQRTITMIYDAPAGATNLDYYGNIGAGLLIHRKITAGAGKASTIYKTTIREVLHRRHGANASRYIITCVVDKSEMVVSE